jgi:hypothetical protein
MMARAAMFCMYSRVETGGDNESLDKKRVQIEKRVRERE